MPVQLPCDAEVPRALRLLRPVLVRAFAHESRRTLLALKAHADTLD